ncbi:hypothetical protein F4805DRAFT_51613 [Annulohypoxylon moriforme]|nr:hypothetical protein F4805DRAFT_51613 [Annulohypoxylon moriforme]
MSDESDIEERVASGEDDNLDEVDSEESDSEEANEFLDLEASESEGRSDDEDASSLYGDGPREFHKFMELPPELRAHVWELFNPDAKKKGRLFKIIIANSASTTPAVWEGEYLEEQTAPARAMLATHHESRQIALRSYPDMFYVRSGWGVPFNNEKDVVLIDGPAYRRHRFHIQEVLSVLGNPKSVAFGSDFQLEDDEEYALVHGYEGSPRNLLRCHDEYEFRRKELLWCVVDIGIKYSVWGIEEIEGISHKMGFMYCWPDFEVDRELLWTNVFESSTDPPTEPPTESEGAIWWPLIEFHHHMRYFKLLDAFTLHREWPDGWSPSSTDTETETEDEYESDGIDDATIDDDEESSEGGDDLIVVQSDSEDDAASTFDGFSPLQVAIREHEGDAIEAGNFSSLEPESPSPDASANPRVDKSDHDSEHAPSDDEEPVQKTTRRKRRIISSDDEHDDEEIKTSSRASKRSRVVLSDSEDEDDGEGVDNGQDVVDESEDDESEELESDESEDEEPKPVKTKSMSIFEKLRQFRDENPVSPDSGAGSDAGSDAEALMDNEDFDEDSESRSLDGEANDDEILDDSEGEPDEEGDDGW